MQPRPCRRWFIVLAVAGASVLGACDRTPRDHEPPRQPGTAPARQAAAHAVASPAARAAEPAEPKAPASIEASATAPLSTFRRLHVPETDGTLHRGFSLDVHGRGTSRVGALDVTGLRGALRSTDGRAPLFVYAKHAWSTHGYDVYQGISMHRTLQLVWLYCAAGKLEHVYVRDARRGELHDEPAHGRCIESSKPSDARVRFADATIEVNTTTSFAIEGARIALGPDAGHVFVRQERFELLPFGEVDCTQGCGPTPWHEIHALLHATGDRVCLGILYLGLAPEKVLLTHMLCLPDLLDPAVPSGEQWLRATWRRL